MIKLLPSPDILSLLLVLAAAAALCAGLIRLTWPWLATYALARPNARSSHTVPTPQGAGIAVILATFIAAGGAMALMAASALPAVLVVFAAAAGLALVGAIDDIRPIAVVPRLLAQTLAVIAVLWMLPEDFRLVPSLSPWLPFWVERAILLVAALWFVNLVNFMDGLDWMTVAEVVPVTAAIALFGLFGAVSLDTTLIAAALCGAMLGFAPFNRPVAKVFLGDVGSLPIGLLTGFCLLGLAYHGHVAAALLLPLYYLADATITLLRRLFNGEAFWQSHRSHFYQRATTHGYAVAGVVKSVFVLNLLLAGFSALSVWQQSALIDVVLVLAGAGAVSVTLWRFSTPRHF